jgi:hypothetical protein
MKTAINLSASNVFRKNQDYLVKRCKFRARRHQMDLNDLKQANLLVKQLKAEKAE